MDERAWIVDPNHKDLVRDETGEGIVYMGFDPGKDHAALAFSYTGKAMAGLIGLIRRGVFKRGENVLFVHTGGSPALYAYQDDLRA